MTFLHADSTVAQGSLLDSSNSTLASPTASAAPGATTTAHAVMRHIPTGNVTMTYNPNSKNLAVKAMMIGLMPMSIHPVQIEKGTCSNAGQGTVLYSLNNVTADKIGNVNFNGTVNNVTTPPSTSGLRISVYNGPRMQTTDQKVVIACGDIKPQNKTASSDTSNNETASSNDNNTTASSDNSSNSNNNNNNSTSSTTSITNSSATAAATGTSTSTNPNTYIAHLGYTQSPNEHANGTAVLRLNNGTLTVQFTAHGLVPNSSHAAHLHAGTCQQIGKIVYDLSPLQADSKGNVTKTMTFSHVSSIPNNGLAAQVHYGTDLSKQESYNPIMCGNVVTGSAQTSQGAQGAQSAQNTQPAQP